MGKRAKGGKVVIKPKKRDMSKYAGLLMHKGIIKMFDEERQRVEKLLDYKISRESFLKKLIYLHRKRRR